MNQGYEDSKRILSESFKALSTKNQRINSEIKSDISIEILKNQNFFIPDIKQRVL
jgi:NTE family protein